MKLEFARITHHPNGEIWMKLLTDAPHDDLDGMGRLVKKQFGEEVLGYTVPESPDFDRWEAGNPCQQILFLHLREKVDPGPFTQRVHEALEAAGQEA